MPRAVLAPAGAWLGSRRQFDGSILRKLLWLTFASRCSTRPKAPLSNRRRIFSIAGLEAAFMTDAHPAPSLFARSDDGFGTGRRQGKWLLAEDMLAGGKRGGSHFFVK